MQQSNFFLRTKLLPPRAVSDLLKRPRLAERLRSHLNYPVTMVAADAGCGKTTLIADFLTDQTRPSVWYQLDHTDADPIVFLNYVAHGIRNFQADFGEGILAYLAEANEDLIRAPERAADLLINEILLTIQQPFILVLDDYHHIGTQTAVHKIVDRILQYSSEYIHLIITTRDLPPLAIMRRKTQKTALVIDREDLLFTDGEVRELFRNTLNIELNDEQVADYRDRTHGWITALQLVRQVAEKEIDVTGDGKALDLSEILQRSEKDIFDYFAEEVFAREDAETQELLLSLSLLKSLPLDHCSLLFPNLRCSAALPELVQRNVFLTVAGDATHCEEYRLHPLFRDFLRRRLRSEIGQAGVSAERNRIAELFLENQHWELALRFLLDAENFERAGELISRRGNDWIIAGAVKSLADFTDKVPDAILEKYPRTLLHKAEIARLQGETELSTSLLNRAVKLFDEQKDKASQAEAFHSLASIARRRANPDYALELLEKAEKLVEPDSETYLKCLNSRGLCFIANGNWNESEQEFRAALELAEVQSNDHYVRLIAHNLALVPGLRGDFGEALRWLNRIFHAGSPGKKLPHEAIGHLNVARLHLYRGEFKEAETHLEKALELAQLFNLRSLIPEILEAYAILYRDTSDLTHAAEYFERSKVGYAEAGVDIATRELNEERARFCIIQGDLRKARVLLEDLINARRELNLDFAVKTASLLLCRVDLMEGNTGSLSKRVAELQQFFQQQDRYYDEALAALLLAETFHEAGKPKETVKPLLRTLDLSARFDYEYWLRTEIRRNQKLFEYEEIAEKLPPDLRAELASAPLTAKGPVNIVEPSSRLTDLTIKVLGPVEIYRDLTKPIAQDAWTTKRAREIFCYIATRKNRRVAKDVLIEEFWGDEDLATVEKNFHPTISLIRKALNSRQALKQNFIIFRDGAYQLNPEFTYSIDSDDFLSFIASAEHAKREKDSNGLRKNLESAYSISRGEFMEGSYEDWAEDQRHFYKDQLARVLRGLAKLSVSEKRWGDALKYADETLKIDPYREDLHRLVLRVLAAQKKSFAVKKHYEGMRALLKDELGIEPSAETNRLYQELIG